MYNVIEYIIGCIILIFGIVSTFIILKSMIYDEFEINKWYKKHGFEWDNETEIWIKENI